VTGPAKAGPEPLLRRRISGQLPHGRAHHRLRGGGWPSATCPWTAPPGPSTASPASSDSTTGRRWCPPPG